MAMRKCIFAGVLSCVLCMSAAVAAQDKSSIKAAQLQGPEFARLLRLDLSALPADKMNQWFVLQGAPGADANNYSIYIVLEPDTSATQVCDVSRDYLDATRPASACSVPDPNVPAFPARANVSFVDAFGQAVNLPLLKPLHADAHYVVTIRNPSHDSHDRIDIPFSTVSSLISPDAAKVRTRLKVNDTAALNATVGQKVKVSRSVTKVANGPNGPKTGGDVYSAIVRQIDTDGVVISVEPPLPIGTSPVQLEVEGLTDYYGAPIKFQGKVQNPPCGTSSGGPQTSDTTISSPGGSANATSVSCAFVTIQLSAITAVHSLPTFAASGAVAPWHPATRLIELRKTEIFFDPVVNFDVGSGNAKSSNSVIVPAQFTRAFVLGLPSNKKKLDPASLMKAPGSRLVGVNATFGPRAEFDTQHGGVNVLAEGRGELYLPQLSKTVDFQKAAIAEGNPAIRDVLELPTNGFSIAPYLQFDAGTHVNSQTISNPAGTAPASIPTYDISRVYFGFYGTAQLGRNTVSLDASGVDLFLTEVAPFTVGKNVDVRRISGVQPHTKATYSVYIDRLKHYAGSICWEDGRMAPSFQYLNKVTVSLKVTY